MSFPRYPKYKDSGVEWLGEVPEHWESRRLKSLVGEPLKYGANESAELDDRSHDSSALRILMTLVACVTIRSSRCLLKSLNLIS